MMHSHTPGPWYCEEPYSGDADPAVYALTAVNKKRRYLARIYGGGALAPRDPEADANTRLIVAAPDMLAALERIANEPCDHGPMPFCPRKVAADALAKARGETKGE